MGRYIAKLWLSNRQYLAVLDNALVIVTVDESGNDIRWNIFASGKNATPVKAEDLSAALKALESAR